MRNALLAAVLLATPVPPCLAQTSPCPLKLEEAPEVRGFKLGREYEAVRKSVPTFQRSHRATPPAGEMNELGVRAWDLSGHILFAGIEPAKYADWNKRMEGVAGLELTFLDDKLAAIFIRYDSSTVWNDPLEFTAAIARSLKLPKQGWRGKSPTFLDCAGFTVETDADLFNARLAIKYRNLEGELVTRKYENQRKKREAFKP